MIWWIGLAILSGIALGCPVWIAFSIGALAMAVGAYWLSGETVIIVFGICLLMSIGLHLVGLWVLTEFRSDTSFSCFPSDSSNWIKFVVSSDLLVIISSILLFSISAFYRIFKPETALPTEPADRK